jgi:hypothetical protein
MTNKLLSATAILFIMGFSSIAYAEPAQPAQLTFGERLADGWFGKIVTRVRDLETKPSDPRIQMLEARIKELEVRIEKDEKENAGSIASISQEIEHAKFNQMSSSKNPNSKETKQTTAHSAGR